MYVLPNDAQQASEIIPDENPLFPGIPIEQRYSADFVAQLIYVPDSTAVEQGWVYNADTGEFYPPVKQEMTPDPLPEPVFEPSEQEDSAGLLVEHEYRLTLLELGLTGGEQ